MDKKQKNKKKSSKKKGATKSFTFKLSKAEDSRYIIYLSNLKDKTQFLRDAIDKAICEDRMKESLWSVD